MACVRCRRYASTGFPGWLISGSGRRHAKPPWLAGTFAGLRAARGTHAATGSASMESAIAALRLAGPFRKALGLPSRLAWGYDDNVLLFKPFLLQNFR